VALAGITSEAGVDLDGDGLFDRLRLNLQLQVARAGAYTWSLKLTTGDRREIDFDSGTSVLDAGLQGVQVEFDGARIGAMGVDGPYLLRDLLLFGPSASLVVTEVGSTRAYRATEFEGALLNRPPTAMAGEDLAVECASPTGTDVGLDGSASSDPDGDALSFEWKDSAGQVLATTSSVQLRLPPGAHTFTLTVNDGKGGSASDSVTVTIQDTTPPDLQLTLDPSWLWPANHHMRAVRARLRVTDACHAQPAITLVSVTSNEPDSGLGHGDRPHDIQRARIGQDDRKFYLRAEHAHRGNGRIYTVVYSARDAAGNTVTRTGQVIVPLKKCPEGGRCQP
jgi:hypothetical protein